MDETLLTQLEAMPDRLFKELEELSESELVRRHPDGGWNLKELVGHLRDAERMWGEERLTRILSEDNPFLPAYDQDEYARNSNASTAPIGETLAEWRSFREQTVAILRGLDPDTLQRTGQHEEQGSITPFSIAHILARHDEQHHAQALELKGLSREPSS